jgi:hypothetical protein
MLGDIVIGLVPISLIILPFVAYLAVKNNWKIVDWF